MWIPKSKPLQSKRGDTRGGAFNGIGNSAACTYPPRVNAPTKKAPTTTRTVAPTCTTDAEDGGARALHPVHLSMPHIYVL
jgi:hypothetical protein